MSLHYYQSAESNVERTVHTFSELRAVTDEEETNTLFR